MAESPITPNANNMNPQSAPFSWVTEFLQRAPAHSVMAGLFLYCFFSVIPEKEAWYWGQLEKQRQEFFESRKIYEDRKETQIKELEKQCYAAISGVAAIGDKNNHVLGEIKEIITQKCSCVK